jgi:peptidyl-prolyl cis-trans isomerase D
MLSSIREKLSTWVIGVLLFFVAVPLIFMGLGNYQTVSETYAFKIDDQVITTAKLEQEVFQYRQALEKNFQGNIPPIYTDNFIKNLTMEYMMRTILLDMTSRDLGLVYHNKSIIAKITNTSSFRDENGFNKDLYKRQLFKISMTPQNYERYIYQKEITEQLKNSITDTSFLTKSEEKNLIKFRHHKRQGSYFIIRRNDIAKSISITDDEISNYYDQNKGTFFSPEKAVFNYLDINKNDIIKGIKINDELIKNIYQKNSKDGIYNIPAKYQILHLLISINQDFNTSEAKKTADKARAELLSGISFAEVVKLYSNDEETKINNGYLGEFILDDLPNYMSMKVKDLNVGDISNIIESSEGFHIISVKEKKPELNTSFSEIKDTIIEDYKREFGSRKYFDLTDEISEENFKENTTLKQLSDLYNLKINKSKTITRDNGYGLFNYNFIREIIFEEDILAKNKTTELIFVNDDRFIIAELDNLIKPEQLTLSESKEIIKSLLLTQKINKKIISKSQSLRDNLNAGLPIENQYKLIIFNDDIDSKELSDNIKKIIFSSNINKGFSYRKLDDNNYVVFVVDNITYPENLKNIDKQNDFSNFVLNTRSESEFSLFYDSIKSKKDIETNKDYLDKD